MKIELESDKETIEYTVEKSIELQGDRYNKGGSVTQYSEDFSVTIDRSNSSEIIANVLISNIKKDGKRSCKNPIDHYFVKSAEPLNKLDLKLTSEGRIDDVLNREEIRKNWDYTKIYLDRYFVSDDNNVISMIKDWTNQIDSKVKDDNLFMQSVDRDMLYDRFFYGYWMDYGENNLLIQNHTLHSMFGEAKTVLTEELTVSEFDNEKHISIVGYLNEDSSDMNLIADFLRMQDEQKHALTVDMKSDCIFEKTGILKKLDFEAEAKIKDSDFKKRYCLTVLKK